VYPLFESLDISPISRLRDTPLREPSFVCDVHLGTLARLLRLAGFDTLYRNDYSDEEIAGYPPRGGAASSRATGGFSSENR
jgi:uncharacterized protein